jgi:predicted TIM-barrel fold metal-dependent hydrolase
MLIADSQVHIWAANTPERPWTVYDPPYIPHRAEPFTKDHLLHEMNAAGVARAIIVPPPLDAFRNDLVLEAARLHPDRLAVMGLFNIHAPDARGRIATWLKQPGMLGLRLTFNIKGDASDDWVWQEAAAANVPIMMRGSNQLPLVERAVQRNPDLRITIDHMAVPPHSKGDAAFGHMDLLIRMAKYPNVRVKASALPTYSSDPYPFRDLHPIIRRVYDAYGPKRMFWGTDLTRMPCPYKQAITLFTEELPWLTEQDKEWIMGRALCEWLGWKLP